MSSYKIIYKWVAQCDRKFSQPEIIALTGLSKSAVSAAFVRLEKESKIRKIKGPQTTPFYYIYVEKPLSEEELQKQAAKQERNEKVKETMRLWALQPHPLLLPKTA